MAKIDLQNCSKNQKIAKICQIHHEFLSFHQNSMNMGSFDGELIQTMFSLQQFFTILWNTAEMLQNCIHCQKFHFSWFFFYLFIYFGIFVMNYINTAHNAVKHCTNTPKVYKSPLIKCLFMYIFLGMYWELHGLRSN